MSKRILRSFSRTNINLHDKSIYQLPRILHGKTLNIYIGVHLHTLHEPMIVKAIEETQPSRDSEGGKVRQR